MKLWGGRFESGPSEVFERFSGSLDFDQRLLDADIRGSQAFARALERVGILTAEERAQIVAALDAIGRNRSRPAPPTKTSTLSSFASSRSALERSPTRSTPGGAATSRSRWIRASGCARSATASARCSAV